MKEEKKILTSEEKKLLGLINASLTSRSDKLKRIELTDGFCNMAGSHSVGPLIFDPVSALSGGKGAVYESIRTLALRCTLQSYRLLFETKKICDLLINAGFHIAVLKGSAVSSFYPIPEYRKSGDIDILLCDVHKKKEALVVLKKAGYRVAENQAALHQIILESDSGIDVELHILLAEPFDNNRINRYMESIIPDIGKHIVTRDVMGVGLPILDDKYQAFELLLHMLQHFLRRGFGLKLLCDWVVYWNDRLSVDSGDVCRDYKRLVSETGLYGFSDMITSVCYRFLGLSEKAANELIINPGAGLSDKRTCEVFLREVMDGGEFGDLDKDRMVMLRDTSLFSYIREFHHQMQLNYPGAGGHVVLWPVLWIMTLVRFLRNNKNKRHTTTASILKKSGKRSKIMKQIHLWE